MDYAFYHLDGKGQIPHLDLLLSLPRLRGIQWVPGDGNPPPEHWLPLLKRIRDGGKLCQVTVSPQGALTTKRPYHPARPKEEVILFLQYHAGKHFDPELVPVFIQVLRSQAT
jgi:hypothetical protein